MNVLVDAIAYRKVLEEEKDYQSKHCFDSSKVCMGLEIAIAELGDMLTIDAVPVVRCKDCAKFEQKGKYYNGTPFGYCYHWDYEAGLSPNEVDGDDFCSYGERRR